MRAFSRTQPCWHPDFRLPASRTLKNNLVVYNPVCAFCYSSLNRVRPMHSKVSGQLTLMCLLVPLGKSHLQKKTYRRLIETMFTFSSVDYYMHLSFWSWNKKGITFSLKNVLSSIIFHKITHFQKLSYHHSTTGKRAGCYRRSG